MACRSQNNPRLTIPDGVPPGVVDVGFRGAPVHTGLTGSPNRSDRLGTGASTRRVFYDKRDLAHSCVGQKKRQHILATPLGKKIWFS